MQINSKTLFGTTALDLWNELIIFKFEMVGGILIREPAFPNADDAKFKLFLF